MRIMGKVLSTVYKGVILVFLIRLLMVSSGLLGAGLRFRFFILFPSTVCLLTLFYYLCAFGWNVWHFWDPEKVTFAPFWKHLVVISLAISLLMVRFFLGDVGDISAPLQNTAFLLYYVIPAMVLLDYIFFDKKGQVSTWEAVAGTAFPLAYLAFIWVMVEGFHHSLWAGRGEGAYPYVFFDIRIVGVGGIVMFLAVVIIGYVVMANIFYWIDQLFVWPTRKRLEEEDDPDLWKDEE